MRGAAHEEFVCEVVDELADLGLSEGERGGLIQECAGENPQ